MAAVLKATLAGMVMATALTACRSPAPEKKPPPESRHSFLWEIRQSDSSAWLFGSIHFARKSVYPLKPAIMNAWQGADTLVVELDLDEKTTLEVQSLVLQHGLLHDNRTLDDVLQPELYKKTTAAFNKMGLPAAQISRFKPWLASLTLTSLILKSSGYSEEHGLDSFFITRSRGKKEIIALESPQLQVTSLANMSMPAQVSMLRQSVDQQNDAAAYMQQLFNAWQSGDAATMQDLLYRDFSKSDADQELLEAMLTRRNRTMLEKIEAMLKEKKRIFVVVGAAHLVGKDGLVEQLKSRNYNLIQH